MSHENSLLEKWTPVLDSNRVEPIKNDHIRSVTAQLLENQEKYLQESGFNSIGGIQNWDPILISLVRRMAPQLIAYDVCGVQAMTGPTGLIFALRAHYADPSTGSVQAGPEALFNEANTAYSGTGDHVGTDPWDAAYSTGTAMETTIAEGDHFERMGITIESKSVTAKSRQLAAEYSIELAQDLRAMHGLDADSEITNILYTQIVTEVNREIVRTIYAASSQGAQFATTAGTFDLFNDADGRWAEERYKNLIYAIERDANAIAIATRRGKGNIMITSADVASALAMAGLLSYAPALKDQVDLNVDPAGPTFAGNLGRMRVFVDPYVSTDGVAIGYRGANPLDAGIFFCPYTSLEMVRAQREDSFHPRIGFKQRYAITSNPFTTMTNNSYYRKFRIQNLV